MRYVIRRRDAVQVAYHWVNFAAIALLTTTGLAILFGVGQTADLFAWHMWAAWLLLVALVAHVWHSTVTLKVFDRMWVSRAELTDFVRRSVSFKKSGADGQKHGHYKVEQIIFHWIVAVDVIGLIVTGFILWKPSRLFVAPFWLPWGWDAIFFARVLHDVFTFVLVALVLAHVYFALFVPKNWPLLRSMFSGRVRLNEYAKEFRISPRLQAHLDAEEREGARTGTDDGRFKNV